MTGYSSKVLLSKGREIHPSEQNMESHLIDFIIQLRKDNQRLRLALRQIALGEGIYGQQAAEYKQIAREALVGDYDGTESTLRDA